MSDAKISLDERLRYMIWLQGVLDIGSAKLFAVAEYFGGVKAIYESGRERRLKSGLFTPKELKRSEELTLEYADNIITKCKENGISIIDISDKKFPRTLRNISDPPAVLYYKGVLPDVDNVPTFSIVGPREVSPFGAKSAYALALRMARAGMIIVSGVALGADSSAHKGALKAAGITIAVSPCGLCHDYLSVNRPLRDEILQKGGCIITECPPEMGIKKYSFHVRNRIISALSLGTAVVEAGERSGALITARHACDQGKDVFVIPGNPTMPNYKGSNELLRDGAKPLLDVMDIFEEYLPTFPEKIDVKKAFENTQKGDDGIKNKKKLSEGLSKEAKIVYNYLDKQKFTSDDLLGTNLSYTDLFAALTELEAEGIIESIPGGFYTFK